MGNSKQKTGGHLSAECHEIDRNRAVEPKPAMYLIQRTPGAHRDPWLTRCMRKLADYGIDDHPPDDPERVQITWIVAMLDDCEECEDPRIELTVEEAGQPGTGLVGHLSPATARRLRAALATALREIGEDPGA